VSLDYFIGLAGIYLIQAFSCGILQRTHDIFSSVLPWGVDLGLLPTHMIYPPSIRTPGYVGFIKEEKTSLGYQDV